ncbi:hypothetical protein JXC34_04895 [Candidatus Woesearchaeota archaeon]|nr:hypothetical protein [Candidatus Woesearchaeota archaeon]
MKVIRTIFIFIMLLSFDCRTIEAGWPIAKITFKAVEENGSAIEAATVRAGLRSALTGKGKLLEEGLTDKNGLFTIEGETYGEAVYSITKDGYYESHGYYQDFRSPNGKIIKYGTFKKWVPWNPTVEVILKKIKNPVPMYAKNLETKIPEIGKPIGFDLIKADWVEPYGEGEVSDFVFKGTREGNKWENFEIELELTFSNPCDGIQEYIVKENDDSYFLSRLKLPHEAPEEGYKKSWVKKLGNTPEKGRFNLGKKEYQNYIFRVRTDTDDNGNIKKALYGKIHGDIQTGGCSSPKLFLNFTYYLNPDGTRNLEFDLKRNLFEGLSSLERPNEP